MYELELKIMLEAGKKAREKIMEIYKSIVPERHAENIEYM